MSDPSTVSILSKPKRPLHQPKFRLQASPSEMARLNRTSDYASDFIGPLACGSMTQDRIVGSYLETLRLAVFRTDRQGAIRISTNGKILEVDLFREGG